MDCGTLAEVRLYLSSFRLGDRTDLFVELVRRSSAAPTIGVIANACDGGPPDLRAKRPATVAAELTALSELGLAGHEIDLRDYAADPEGLAGHLAELTGLWVRGGNTFTLRMALATSGSDQLIPDLIRTDALVYAGYSAGACVLAPDLHGLELCDDPAAAAELYGTEPRWDGLGVLDRPFVPHLDSPGHPETELTAKTAAHYRLHGQPYWGLRDGQALVVDGDLATAAVH